MAISQSLRQKVVVRARHRCEYCGLSQVGQAATFHVDHITPVIACGLTKLENLALACIHCSLCKGARQTAMDTESGVRCGLYHPRRDRWNLHFRWSGYKLIGISAIGRATISALGLNSAEHLIIRSFEKRLGRHPPPGHV